MKKYKYVDKQTLNMINHLARDILQYNRAVTQECIDALPEDKFFPVVFSMLHEHKAGKLTEPHMRCMFLIPMPERRILIDVEMGLYNLMPEVEIPDDGPPVVAESETPVEMGSTS